jgi:hypothetical protein
MFKVSKQRLRMTAVILFFVALIRPLLKLRNTLLNIQTLLNNSESLLITALCSRYAQLIVIR